MLEEAGEASRESASGLDSLGGLLLNSGLSVLGGLLSLGDDRRLLSSRGSRGLGNSGGLNRRGGGGLSSGLTGTG